MILKVSEAWASKIIDCTLTGILNGCHARCCKGYTFYPSKSNIINNKPMGICVLLGSNGCVLKDADKPIKCLLYPFVISKSNGLCIHGRAILSICKECYNKGNKSILETQQHNLSLIFGEEIVFQMIHTVIIKRRDFTFRTTPGFDMALRQEQELEDKNIVPIPRTRYWNLETKENMLL